MDHLAIMKKSWNLLPKIISGEKKIESRWYKAKYPPWDRIKAGEMVYFKDSGEPVTLKAEVEKILQFSNLNPEKVKEIFEQYGSNLGIGAENILRFTKMFQDKNYCLLIFLKNPEKIEPFEIDKTGFGNACAWICVDEIETIRKK